MGGRGAYSRTNGFADGKTENEFINVGGKTVDGIKVLQNTKANNSSLPEYANTSTEYISYNPKGAMLHLRVYDDHVPIKEFDLGHSHHHGLKEGEIHVHTYSIGIDGHPVRSRESRLMTDSEKRKYGAILQIMKESKK